ncbi:hypothetical protein F2Q69_00022817 [Brassica cretica]|uniref:Uncharacterized protein n=1 Tax=Brassica cretica TaxID=69181 RepID=A0A3N6QVW9_BRACR|nr:hypothetical protein F2Q69_00022817 [Brassica cretica]
MFVDRVHRSLSVFTGASLVSLDLVEAIGYGHWSVILSDLAGNSSTSSDLAGNLSASSDLAGIGQREESEIWGT